MKISILTLGCRTNQAESLYLEKNLIQKGHNIVDSIDNPDVCIINTCAVTIEAERQSRQLINKAIRKGIKVFVTGCYAELCSDNLNKDYKDLVFLKNNNKYNIINMLPFNISSITESISISRHRPIIKVQEGCNYSCSYCSIPFTRGRSKSVEVERIMEEVFYYEDKGFNEIVLTGTHIGLYGEDLEPKNSLSQLIKTIIKKSQIPRIRISSIDINEIDEELLEVFCDNRLCKHLHIPLQSGDDHILRLMKRRYSVSEYESQLEKITKKIPDISIGTDIIVGFPGETEFSFNNTREFITSMPFSYLHVFPYSKRPKTLASTYSTQIPEEVKKKRASDIREIGRTKKIIYMKKFLDNELNVLIEECNDEFAIGTADNYIKVLIKKTKDIQPGMIATVRINSIKDTNAFGDIVNIS